jgi:hypothetical protein
VAHTDRVRRVPVPAGLAGCWEAKVSWEAWGGGPEPFDVDDLYKRGWESDENGEMWWKRGEPENRFTFAEAIQAYEDWLVDDGEDYR